MVVVSACTGGAQQSVQNSNNVTICHNPPGNPGKYSRRSVAKDAAVGGHDNDSGDITPPFSYIDSSGNAQQYPGKNWGGDGQAIYGNGCKPITTATTVVVGVQTAAPTETAAPTTQTTTASAETTTAAAQTTIAAPTTEATTAAGTPLPETSATISDRPQSVCTRSKKSPPMSLQA